MDSRFCTRTFDGTPKKFFFVEKVEVSTDTIDTHTEPSHHIILIDASGSMYHDMDAIKTTVEKILTLEEFANSDQLVSLLSYSSSGDVRTHFSRVRVGDVMAPGSQHVKEIRNLRVRGMTCISQVLEQAKNLCQPDELTCISLHSDGYANDISPNAEKRAIDRIIADFAGIRDVYVNTLAYRQYCDFNLLAAISNALSGKCIQAKDIHDVYNALHDTSVLLDGQRTPAIVSPLGSCDYQVFVSIADQRVNGSDGDLKITGLSQAGDKTIYRYREVSKDVYDASSLPEADTDKCVYAYARAMLASGQLNDAKYATITTRDTELYKHLRALTNEDRAAYLQELDDALEDSVVPRDVYDNYGVDTSKASVLEILDIMESWKHAITVDYQDLQSKYNRRGLKRIAGVREKDGSVTTPGYTTKIVDKDWLRLSAVEINRDTASANIKLSRRVQLMGVETGDVVENVAGIDISTLYDYKNYTVVGDGSLNFDSLKVRLSDKRAHRDLWAAGVVNSATYTPKDTYIIDFTGRPLVSYDQDCTITPDVPNTLMQIRVLKSILKALLEDTSEKYTSEQIAALKEHFLTPNLYISFPTTNDYIDLKEALASGQVDTRVSYKITLGDTDILNPGKLKSANAYLQRRFEAETEDGSRLSGKDLKWSKWWDNIIPLVKSLSSRTKLDAVDALMMPIFEDFLRVTDTRLCADLIDQLQSTTAGGIDTDFFMDALKRKLSQDQTVEIFKTAQEYLDKIEKEMFTLHVCPIAFYVGSSGLIPEYFDVGAMTYDQLQTQYPNLAVSKDEQDGMFFVRDRLILSVFSESVYFSTGH